MAYARLRLRKPVIAAVNGPVGRHRIRLHVL